MRSNQSDRIVCDRDGHSAVDIDIELATQELLAPFSQDDVLEIHDVIAIATTCESDVAANAEAQVEHALDETSEIELTPEQMDAMLEGRFF